MVSSLTASRKQLYQESSVDVFETYIQNCFEPFSALYFPINIDNRRDVYSRVTYKRPD